MLLRTDFTDRKNFTQFTNRFNSSLIRDGKLSIDKLTVNLPHQFTDKFISSVILNVLIRIIIKKNYK